ncbi:glycosyltransferase domain-containing protein [Xanthobacter autotrophicus DSM 431]|uniref:glycosyltransferase domain-containing protein n=1 Tax=Xanthobacter nonsaccharivorans TaxID=3119912 RepID=UPI00372B2D46
MSAATARRACVYTCLMGGYEALNEQPVAASSAMDFICFTDDPDLASDTWRIVRVTPVLPSDPVRSQRVVKLSPQELLPDYDVSLYIDNSISLLAPPEEILACYLTPRTLAAIPGHSFRASIADEFLEILRLGYDDAGRILEQLNHYRLFHPQVLDEVPFWSGLMIRRHHDPKVVAAMRLWLTHVMRYSRRDQVSGPLAYHLAGLEVERLAMDNRESWCHRWPVIQKRDRSAFPFSAELSQLPPEILGRRWLHEKAELEARLAGALSRTADVEAALAQFAARNEELNARLGKTSRGPLRGVFGRAFGRLLRKRQPGR